MRQLDSAPRCVHTAVRMNVLPFEKQQRVIASLVEGMSIRSTERSLEVHRDTVMRLGLAIGEGCERLHDRLVRGVYSSFIELDEIWTFVHKKQGKLEAGDDPTFGDQYTYVALGSSHKLAISYLVGKRTAESTKMFAADLRERVIGSPQINTDGFVAYRDALEEAFGSKHSHGIAIKVYEGEGTGVDQHRYAPGRVKEVNRFAGRGSPVMDRINTSYVERNNLTIRMSQRRFTRLCNAFSKKLPNLRAAVALHFAHYNFVRIHETLRVTPAMAAGLAQRPWSIGELIEAARDTYSRSRVA